MAPKIRIINSSFHHPEHQVPILFLINLNLSHVSRQLLNFKIYYECINHIQMNRLSFSDMLNK